MGAMDRELCLLYTDILLDNIQRRYLEPQTKQTRTTFQLPIMALLWVGPILPNVDLTSGVCTSRLEGWSENGY